MILSILIIAALVIFTAWDSTAEDSHGNGK
jgi:hypothetical protein